MKRYMNCALLYSVLAMAGGVFYREFTKLNAFTGKTTISVVHTHYFLLGMVVFLLLLLLEKNFSFTGSGTGKVLAVYHTGLNLTALMFVVRGVTQVLGSPLTSGMDAAISGMAGIGHILLGISLVLLLLQIRRASRALNPRTGKHSPANRKSLRLAVGRRDFFFRIQSVPAAYRPLCRRQCSAGCCASTGGAGRSPGSPEIPGCHGAG